MDEVNLTQPTQAIPEDDLVVAKSHTIWGRLIPLTNGIPHFQLEKDEYVVGRSSSCSIQLTSPELSQFHCRIYRVPDDNYSDLGPTIMVEDLSTHGTFLDGKKIGKGNKKVLSHGSTLALTSKIEQSIQYLYTAETQASKHEKESAISKHYHVRETLGSGNFAVVKVAISLETARRYAVKIIDKKKIMVQPALAEAFRREVEILRGIKHPGIVCYVDYFDDEDFIFIVLELATGGELARKIFRPEADRLKEADVRFVFFQLAVALKYLHDRRIAHRDLKPENVLVASNDNLRVMITDFGLSRMTSQASMMNTVCGTPLYLAPEILKNQPGGYDCAVDCWSMGVMLFVMLSGQLPFQEESRDELFAKIIHGDVQFNNPQWSLVSPEAIDLIKSLLVVDPSKRYTVNQILCHPWLRDPTLVQQYQAIQKSLPNEYQHVEIVLPQLKSTNNNSAMMDVDVRVNDSASMQVDTPPSQSEMNGVFRVPLSPKRRPPPPPVAQPVTAAVQPPTPQITSLPAKQAAVPAPIAIAVAREVTATPLTSGSSTSSNSDGEFPMTKRKRSQPDELTPSKRLPRRLASSSSNSSTSGGWLKLLSLNGSKYPSVVVSSDTVILGRDPACLEEVRFVNQPKISNQHCIIRKLPDGSPELEDTSSNGTWVNEKLIGKGNRVALKLLDEIVLLRQEDNRKKVIIGYCAKFQTTSA